VTPADADGYKIKMIGEDLAPLTIRKRLQFAKMIFRAAIRHRLIEADPFDGVSVKATMSDRRRFVTLDETARLLDACPCVNWRTIVALARYGGLRCPSEVLSLRWQDIDWLGSGRVIVQSPKTAHHPGKETRLIPLFHELLPWLREAAEIAPKGAVYVVDERFRRASLVAAGWRNCNLRTTFLKIVARAGLKAWPRPFHNLRSSRETELTRQFPMHVVVAWLGHTEEIALRHYCQVTDADFEQASKLPDAERAQKCAQSRAVGKENAVNAEDTPLKEVPRFPMSSPQVLTSLPLKADGEGFEPTVGLLLQQFSRLPP